MGRRVRATRRLLIGVLAIAACAGKSDRYDVLIVGGSVVDGTAAEARTLDVAIVGDRIVAMAPSLDRANADRVIDATGRTVSPGFIDLHAHLEPLLELPLMESAHAPRRDLRARRTRWRLAAAARPVHGLGAHGHGGHQRGLPGGAQRDPSHRDGHGGARAHAADELAQMQQLVAEAMGQGAFGLSTGLLYLPGTYSNVDEVVALAQVASDSGGMYTSHLRKEGIGLLDGVGEALEIGRRAKIPVVLTHHKAVGQQMWGKSTLTLAMVDSARKARHRRDDRSVSVHRHAHHRGAGAELGDGGRRRRVSQARGTAATQGQHPARHRGQHPQRSWRRRSVARAVLARVMGHARSRGRRCAIGPTDATLAPTPENGALLVLEAMMNGGGNAIYHVLDEGDVKRIMAHPMTMIASDGRLSRPGEGHPHPRAYGTFPRVLGEYVREQGVLTLAQACTR
jgi:N-acyl-D-amino-acid deacylase